MLKLKVNNQNPSIIDQEEHGDSGVTYCNSSLLRVITSFNLNMTYSKYQREYQ